MNKPGRLVLFDPGFGGAGGHHFSTLLLVDEGCAQRGMECICFVNANMNKRSVEFSFKV